MASNRKMLQILTMNVKGKLSIKKFTSGELFIQVNHYFCGIALILPIRFMTFTFTNELLFKASLNKNENIEI